MLIQGHFNPHHLPVTWRARPPFYRHLGIPYMLLQPITHLLQTGPRFDSATRTQMLSQTRTEPVTTSAQRQLIYGTGYQLEMTRRFIMWSREMSRWRWKYHSKIPVCFGPIEMHFHIGM